MTDTLAQAPLAFEPLYDRLIVRVIQSDDRTKGGLYVPQMSLDNTPFLRGEVLFTGHGRITSQGGTVPLVVKPGDVIVFIRSQQGEQIFVPDTKDELICIRESHVVWIVRGLENVSSLTGADGKPLVLQ